jgi:hypothetical protein
MTRGQEGKRLDPKPPPLYKPTEDWRGVGFFALTSAGQKPAPAHLGSMRHPANLLNVADGGDKGPE